MPREDTTIGLDAPDALPEGPPSDDTQLAVYPVTGLPPLSVGGSKAIVTLATPPVALSIVGAPGTVAGTTAFDAADAKLVPMPFVAVTVHV